MTETDRRPNEGAYRFDKHIRWGNRKLGLWVFRFGPAYGKDEWNVSLFLGPVKINVTVVSGRGK